MGRRGWVGELEPRLAERGGASRRARHVPPLDAEVLSLQARAGNHAVVAALQRDTPKQAPKPPPQWLQDAESILADMAKTDKLLGSTKLRNYSELNATLRKFEYGAWTESAQEIFVKDPFPKGSNRKDKATQRLVAMYVRYELTHEAVHVHQFDRDGGPPTTWRRMLEYEKEAYESDVKWLSGPGKQVVTDPDAMQSITSQVNKNLKDVTGLLDGIAKLPPKTDVEKHLHKEMIRLKLIPSKSGLNPQDLYKQP